MGDEDKKWLLFAREEDPGVLVFTALVTMRDTSVMAEIAVNEDTLTEHSEELGLEMEACEFRALLLKTLEQREFVDLEVETEDGSVKEVFLTLTYKFSPTISRKGVFQLPIVATDVPPSVVRMLECSHVTPSQPMWSEQQKAKEAEKKLISTTTRSNKSTGNLKTGVINSQDSKNTAIASQNSDTDTTNAPINPMRLKRRHVPTGTMRRKGPKGAKLVKK
ncbi:hypothetical protein P3T76_014966 [Phytophthora citrophthora]|uniref:Uncharacterized protein n=1 Tax=Phytophthora citrophthora TaxID=4793 RepID=A0AAD9G0D4_9STRA|nr:hypothetical protein P3T76_014966 [Phytophthora citrophthora]